MEKENSTQTLGLSDNKEIKELQTKYLELLKLIHVLKTKSEVAHENISNNITSLKEDVLHAHHDAHSKDDIINNINLFIAEFKGLSLNQRLSSLNDKYNSLHQIIDSNKIQTKINQRTMTIIYLAGTTFIGILSIALRYLIK